MHSEEPIRSVLIVGGGIAGWMTATYLSVFLRPLGCRIEVLESADLGTIGVGEATLPRLVTLLRNLRLDEPEFMRSCGATYKLGTRFDDWQGSGHRYWHPYGVCGGTIDGIELFHPWLRAHLAGADPHAFSDHSMQARVAEALKAPRPLNGTSPIMDSGAYGYHLDATALATFLKGVATGQGVSEHFDEVEGVEIGDDGAIAAVRTKGGRDLSADLYIDCTGFAGLLIERALGDPWVDWSDTLLCDRVVLSPLPHDPELPPFTQASALSAGWRWRIPLSHRVGTGYLYSSRHCDDEAATAELIGSLPPREAVGTAPRYLRLRTGRRSAFWVANCVAVGTAGSFIEPLESTGIHFVQMALEALVEYFPDRCFDPILRRDYNAALGRACDETRDFVLLHYLLSNRDQDPFWRDARAVRPPDSLAEALERYDATGAVLAPGSPFSATSYHFIYAGNGRLPRRPNPQVNRIDPVETLAILERIRTRNAALAAALPTHRALIQAIHERVW